MGEKMPIEDLKFTVVRWRLKDPGKSFRGWTWKLVVSQEMRERFPFLLGKKVADAIDMVSRLKRLGRNKKSR